MGRTKIEWCDWVYNPVWGCRNECPYCYARRTAKRWGLQVCGRDDFAPTWVKSNFEKEFPKKPSRIFVNSMSDVAFWEDQWLLRVLMRIMDHPEHTFLMLTKDPEAYGRFDAVAGPNLWFGVTATNANDAAKATGHLAFMMRTRKLFLSIEPLHGQIIPLSLKSWWIDWVIVGAETGNRKDRVVPERDWMDAFLDLDKPVFMKDSLIPIVGEKNMRREFPS